MNQTFIRLIFLLLLLTGCRVTAQTADELQPVETDSLAPVADPKYREDQFYASISYNLVQSKPRGYSLNSLSVGLTGGVLRDMPVNSARTHSIAVGLGYSYNNIKHNLKISEAAGQRVYNIATENFDLDKLVLHYAELPIEFRWRNSDSISHKFWRIYTGFKISYLFVDKSEFESSNGSTKVTGNDDLNRIVYGAYISAGWNTWNFYAYYGITPIFKSSAVLADGRKVGLNSLNLGLVFYIL